ncbi:hypothetical protein [Priestia megaterium]|uniref:hypothetical protein n=1 Tax=Priestia megaterium TaxID=1404 RepID=UPI0022B8ED07|nr:hypothetical protein [Priestia megaterium]MCZ8495573.1 hypothetical protein [Priestia megaterium]
MNFNSPIMWATILLVVFSGAMIITVCKSTFKAFETIRLDQDLFKAIDYLVLAAMAAYFLYGIFIFLIGAININLKWLTSIIVLSFVLSKTLMAIYSIWFYNRRLKMDDITVIKKHSIKNTIIAQMILFLIGTVFIFFWYEVNPGGSEKVLKGTIRTMNMTTFALDILSTILGVSVASKWIQMHIEEIKIKIKPTSISGGTNQG